MKVFNVRMTEQQLGIIHDALVLYRDCQADDPTLEQEDIEELAALVDLTDQQGEYANVPKPAVNGWAL